MSEPKAKVSRSALALAASAFHKYSPGLHRYLSRRIRGGTDVADLTQEIFERFLRVKVTEAIRNPQAYLFRIASHVVSDSLLRDEHSVVTYDSEAVEGFANNAELGGSDDLSDQVALSQSLHRAISHLPDMHRAVLLLVVRDGLSHTEVATKTGLSVSTVGLYVCEARARIRTALSED